MNSVIQVDKPVLGISLEDGGENGLRVTGQKEDSVSESSESQDELDELPLSEFERDMVRLQNEEQDQELSHVISQLESNYAKERENIYSSGFQAGMEAGKQELQQQYRDDVLAVQSMLKEMEESFWRLKKDAELGLVNLAIQISRHVIQTELKIQPETIREIVEKTLTYANNLEVISVALNPEDYHYLTGQSDIQSNISERIQFEKDSSITRGGCVVHTNMESIDARIETKLEQLAEQLYLHLTEEGAA